MKRLLSVVLVVAMVAALTAGCGCGGRNVDKEAGFEVDKYIKLGEYTGFKYDIDQKKFDDLLEEKTFESEAVNRAAKMGDEIEFSYKGYVDGKKVDDLTQSNIAAETNQKDNAVYKKMTDALIGKSKGDTATVKIPGSDVKEVSKDKKTYKGTVTFKLKVVEVSKVEHAKVTNEWVKEESGEDAETVEEFFKLIEEELVDNAKADVWQMAIDDSTMSSWPPELYDKVKEEEEGDAAYNAEQWSMSLEEYYAMNGDTEDSLNKEYMNQVQSTLVMWAIVGKEDIKVTKKEINDRYNDLFTELKGDGEYNSMDEVKKNYPENEIKEAVYLQKTQDFVYDNSKVKKTYKVHNNK